MPRKGFPIPLPMPPGTLAMPKDALRALRDAIGKIPFDPKIANEIFAALRELNITLGDACPYCTPIYKLAEDKTRKDAIK